MKRITFLFLTTILFLGCQQTEISSEYKSLVKLINKKIDLVDSNHRVTILEDDFHEGDSIYKIRAYYLEDYLVKIVSIMRTSEVERDDYFYFDAHNPIFSGHLVNERNEHLAAEYKFYYDEGEVVESLFWKDSYIPGQRFPHEHFEEYTPDLDSLMVSEKNRLMFCLKKLEMDGFEIKHLNENLDANSSR